MTKHAEKHAMQILILAVIKVNFLALEHHWLYTFTALATGPVKSINCTALRPCFDALFSHKNFNYAINLIQFINLCSNFYTWLARKDCSESQGKTATAVLHHPQIKLKREQNSMWFFHHSSLAANPIREHAVSTKPKAFNAQIVSAVSC